MILLVENDTLIINNTLPILEIIQNAAIRSQLMNKPGKKRIAETDEGTHFVSFSNGLAWFILTLSHSIPVPLGPLTSNTLHQLVSYSRTGMQYGGSTAVADDDIVEIEEVDDLDENNDNSDKTE